MKSNASFLSLLDDLGVTRGDVIFMHTSYARLKPFGLSPEALLETLLERLAPDGTLVLPAYAWHIDPTARPWKGYAEYFRLRPAFDTRTTPTNLGCVPEVFRRRNDVKRSESYWWSICASGPLADEITRNQAEVKHYYAPGSSFERLYRLGVKILGLGVTLNTTSLALIADNELGPEHRPRVFTAKPQQGRVVCRDGQEIVTEAYWLLPEVVRHIKPEQVFVQSLSLRSAMHRKIDGDTIYFCYPYSSYHDAALLLGRSAISKGNPPPWLAELPQADISV